ncbi:HEAT repeat domain-containing protein [Streptomyces sp. R-07]|uniref:HEAT repeat domain-containing protein n=1 Tax=Streptomyces sp. R-07 TaxID=3404052 RepID=UPI003CF24F9A
MPEPDGVDDIAWGALEHAYGAATDVPGRLRALYRPDEAAEAADELLSSIHHSGGCVASSAVAALPFLVRAAADPAVTVRADLLDLVACLACSGNTVEPRWVARGWAEAWDSAVTVLLPLLHDPSAEVRRAVTEVLGEARPRAAEVLARLWARWETETDPAVRHRIVEAVGDLAPHTDREREQTVGRLRELTEPGVEPGVRLRAVEALRAALPGTADPRYARVVADVLAGGDLGGRSVTQAIRLLGADASTVTGLLVKLLGHADVTTRRGALEAAAGELSRWRTAVPALLPAVAALLGDPEPENRLFAARVLGMCGTAARPWADRLAAMVTDEGEPYLPAQDHALWALSRTGDPRCAEPLARRLAGERLGFATYSVHSQGWWTHELSLHETLAPLATHAEVLLPPLRAALAAADCLDARRALCQVLTDWGPAAGPAIPQLIGLLETDGAVWALDALAAIGPEAAAAVDRARLRALLRVRPPGQPFAPAMLAVAYGRLTGDREPARRLLLPGLAEPYGRDQALVLLGELGPAGAPYADRLRELLHRDGTGWLPLRAGEALWRITGRAGEVVPALVAAIEPYARGGVTRAVTETVRLLGAIGPAAASAVPVLRAFLDADERPVEHGSWRSVPEDDELCAAARAALIAVSGV